MVGWIVERIVELDQGLTAPIKSWLGAGSDWSRGL
jgi:hypothetical protein